MTITEFLTARLDEDEAVARAADIPEGDPSWTVHGPVALSHPDAFRVRTSRDMVPVALVQDVDDNAEPIPSEILDAEAAAAHIARHDPARVLADVAAKRAIVASFLEVQEYAWRAPEGQAMADGARVSRETLRQVLLALALPYAEHEDYDEGWRP